MADGSDHLSDDYAEQSVGVSGSLMDRPRREMFWIKLRVGILDVLKELRAQEEKRGDLVSEEQKFDNTRQCESEVKSDDSLHLLVQRIERHFVDHLHLIEGFVAKQEAQYEKMQAFLLPDQVGLRTVWQRNVAQVPFSRQTSPPHDSATDLDSQEGNGTISEAKARQIRSRFSMNSELVESNFGNRFSERNSDDLDESWGRGVFGEPSLPFDMKDSMDAGNAATASGGFRDPTSSDRFAARPSINSADGLRKDHERWQTVKHGISERRLLRSRTLTAKVQKKLGIHGKKHTVRDSPMVRFVQSTGFHSTCSMFIVLNAAFIGYQSEASVDAAMEMPPADDPAWFKSAGRIFLGFFVIELLLRIIALRSSFVIGPDWQWNMFDFFLVLSSGVEEILDAFNLSFFRTLRILRMVRTLRIIRVLRFFRELRQMVSSILHTLSSLAWALILLLLIMYLFSIVFMQAAAAYIKEPESDSVRGDLIKWFRTMFGSMFSLFRAISGGQDWVELQHPLGEISFIYSGFFATYVFFVVFGVLNVLISVFVERAHESGKLDRDLVTQAEQKAMDIFTQEMHDVFQEIDESKIGFIRQKQFEEYIRNHTVKAFFKTRNLDAAAHRLFNIHDSEDNRVHTMDVDEFTIRMMRLRGDARTADVHLLLQDGRLRYQKLKGLMRILDNKLNYMLQSPVSPAACLVPPSDSKAANQIYGANSQMNGAGNAKMAEPPLFSDTEVGETAFEHASKIMSV